MKSYLRCTVDDIILSITLRTLNYGNYGIFLIIALNPKLSEFWSSPCCGQCRITCRTGVPLALFSVQACRLQAFGSPE